MFHGSTKRIEGPIRPSPARDSAGIADNQMRGVYASRKKSVALAIALSKCVKGRACVNLLYSDPSRPPCEILWGELPISGHVYLYTLDERSFAYRGGQWVSATEVRPVGCEKVRIADCGHLMRKLRPLETLRTLAEIYYCAALNRLSGWLR